MKGGRGSGIDDEELDEEQEEKSLDLELEELAKKKEPFDLVVEDIQNVTAQEVRKIKERRTPEKEKAVHIEIDSPESHGNVYKYPPIDLLDESHEDLKDN